MSQSRLVTITNLATGAKMLALIEDIAAGALPGQGLPEGPTYPGQGLPTPPVDPGWGGGAGSGPRPGNELPPLPPDPVHPGHALPRPPQVDNGLPIFPGRPDHELPPPGTIYPPLPPNAGVPAGKALVLVYISGVGARWTVIDTSLSAGTPLPTPPTYPTGQPVPPLPMPT